MQKCNNFIVVQHWYIPDVLLKNEQDMYMSN